MDFTYTIQYIYLTISIHLYIYFRVLRLRRALFSPGAASAKATSVVRLRVRMLLVTVALSARSLAAFARSLAALPLGLGFGPPLRAGRPGEASPVAAAAVAASVTAVSVTAAAEPRVTAVEVAALGAAVAVGALAEASTARPGGLLCSSAWSVPSSLLAKRTSIVRSVQVTSATASCHCSFSVSPLCFHHSKDSRIKKIPFLPGRRSWSQSPVLSCGSRPSVPGVLHSGWSAIHHAHHASANAEVSSTAGVFLRSRRRCCIQ